jgi:hemoglobin
MTDIRTKEDIQLLIDRFYKKVVIDPVIGHFFTSVIHLSWDVHIPVMVSFWETVLLGATAYKGNPMIKHVELNKLAALEPHHFERWLQLWRETVQENYDGPIATLAVAKAGTIAQIIQQKIKPAPGNLL